MFVSFPCLASLTQSKTCKSANTRYMSLKDDSLTSDR